MAFRIALRRSLRSTTGLSTPVSRGLTASGRAAQNVTNDLRHSNAETYGALQRRKPLNPALSNRQSAIPGVEGTEESYPIPDVGTVGVSAPAELTSAVEGQRQEREAEDQACGIVSNPDFYFIGPAGESRGYATSGNPSKISGANAGEEVENTEGKHVGTKGLQQVATGKEPVGNEKGELAESGHGSFAPPEAGEMAVGELEGGKFRIEPLRREGEDLGTMRARLLYQSRKRGTLESDLLMSTFADQHLGSMSLEELREYDRFLDENDWDIYYWATQEPASVEAEQEAKAGGATPGAYIGTQGNAEKPVEPAKGEWAQTIGTFKPLYRPVPSRWKESRILKRLRKHVADRSAGGVAGSITGKAGKGMAFMPAVKNFD
jgi:succinate dehydrogenase flavin-adding protein (antitoxin of CptAB toxin-antitoxin module)